MEGNFNFKNLKPTLSKPTELGKNFDINFKKTMKKNGMNLKETTILDEKKESLKKKIFKLDKMETLVHSDEFLSKIFSELEEDADELYGYHWNETLMNIIFNEYVLNSPKYLQKYKNTRPIKTKRRGEEGIKELQKDIEKEKEATGGAEKRKQDLLKIDNASDSKEKEELDEFFNLIGKNIKTTIPFDKRSIHDTFFVDVKNNKLIEPVPNSLPANQKMEIVKKYAGNPNIKQIAWFDAVGRGVKGVEREVPDGSYDQVKKEMDTKYKSQGGYENIPALTEDIKIGMKYKISDGSGLDSNKIVTVVKPEMVKVDGTGVPMNVSGAYKPVDWKKEVAIQYEDGSIGTMFKSRLTPVMGETTGSGSSGAYNMGLDAQNDIEDKTYQNETTTSSSSGQYSGKAIWAKSPAKSRFANKAAWHGGKIIGESVINGDMNYLSDSTPFKKYIIENEINDYFDETINLEEGETFKETAQKLYDKLLLYAQDTPKLLDDDDFNDLLKIFKYEAETGRSHPSRFVVSKDKNIDEHHLFDRNEIIDFMMKNGNYSMDVLNQMGDEELNQEYISLENELGINEQPDFDAMLKKDLKYTGHELSGDESTEDLKSKDGLFKNKWNENKPIDEKNGLWDNIHAKRERGEKPLSKGQEGYPDKKQWDKLTKEGFGGDPEVGEDQYNDSQELNSIIGQEISDYKNAVVSALKSIDGGDKLISHVMNLKPETEGYNFLQLIDQNQKRGFSPEHTANAIRDAWYGVNEAAVSKKQQKFFGMVNAAKKGELKNPSAAVEKAAETMTDKEVKDFASTKHKGLPEKVSENVDDIDRENLEVFLSFNDEDIYWKWINDEISSSDAINLMRELNNIDYNPNTNYRKEYIGESMKKNTNEGIFNLGNELKDDEIIRAIENFKLSQESPNARNKFVRVKDYIRNKAGNIVRMPQLKLWLDKNMPKISTYVDTLWGNWDLMSDRKLAENMKNENYKKIVKELIESTGKSFKMLNEDEKKMLFEDADLAYQAMIVESMIDDQPDSMINNQQTSMVKSMDSGELNVDGNVAASSIGGVKESEEIENAPVDDTKASEDAENFRKMLKAKYGVESISDLSNRERQELMKSMEFDKQDDNVLDFTQFKATDAERDDFKKRDVEKLEYLSRYDNEVNSVDDYKKLSRDYKMATGENMFHPMAILASIQRLPSDSILKNKLKNIEQVLTSAMKKKINEERKTSAILNVEKLGKENAKNFKKDKALEDGLKQDETYPKENAIHKAPVYPNPKDFYIEQDLDKVQKEAKSMEDIEKEALKKSKNALKNVGNSTNEKGNEIPKRNLSKEEMYQVAMNRGDGMQDIVYDNKPSDKFEKRMENDMGKDVYKSRNEKMDYKAKAPMYNKDTQPVDVGSEKNKHNKFKKGYNSESVTGKYKDEFNKYKLVEFNLSDVDLVKSINENAVKISLDGMGNKYELKDKTLNEDVVKEEILNNYDFYLVENSIVAIEKTKEGESSKMNESFNKMKHLMNYDPNNYVNTKKSVKF